MEIEKQVRQLNRLLSNYFVLYIKLHRYSWYVKGVQRFSLQPIFIKQTALCKEHIDQISELILSLGGQPFATMVKYLKEATLSEANADDEVDEMMEQIMNDTMILLKDIDFLIIKSNDEQKSRFILYTLTLLERDLFQVKQDCERYMN